MMFSFDDITQTYSQTHNSKDPAIILNRLTLRIEAEQFLCILGPSGCGKTTLLNLAAGFLQPDSGQIFYQQQPITGPDPERGVVFQDATLFPWLTVLGNVKFGLDQTGIEPAHSDTLALQALQQVGMDKYAAAWPATLSGGMRQRVAIARVLALKSPTLLMDEPFSALDANSREHLQDCLLDIWQQQRQTIIYVTHSVEEAAYLGSRIIIMGPAPENIRADIEVSLPRPRLRSSLQIQQLMQHLRNELDQLPCCIDSKRREPQCH